MGSELKKTSEFSRNSEVGEYLSEAVTVRKIGWGLEIAHRLGQFKRLVTSAWRGSSGAGAGGGAASII